MPVMEQSAIHSKNSSVLKKSKGKSLKRKKKRGIKKPSFENKNQSSYKSSYHDILGGEQHEKDPEELYCEALVFGDDDGVVEEFSKKAVKKLKKGRKQIENNWEELIISGDSDSDLDINRDGKRTRKEVWEDEDDDNFLVQDKAVTLQNCHRSIARRGGEKYKEYVEEKFIKLMGDPKWASTSKGRKLDSSEEDSEDELLQKAGNYISQSAALTKGTVDIRKCRNLDEDGVKMGVIKCVEFHPTSKVALVAGFSGTATLFQVDGKVNPKIQSVHFERFPIHTAHFTMDGEQIIVGSREYGHFFSYDMISGKTIRVPWERDMDQMNVRRFHVSPDGKLIAIYGKYGNTHLITAKTKEWIGTLKMNGEVFSIAFNKDGSRMFTHGDTGQIYVWDMSSRTCVHKFSDQGCVTGTSLAVSPNQRFLAAGSDCGVVNIYEMSSLLSSSDPQPLKAVMNLTTEVTSLKFNCTSEILAMASSHKANSVKLIHFPSISVFSNFPVMNQDLRHINSLDISLNSGFLAFGNNVGKAYLYRLKHYGNY